jgi:hypothetical protein
MIPDLAEVLLRAKIGTEPDFSMRERSQDLTRVDK